VTPNDDKPTDAFDLSTGQGFERFVLACQQRLFAFLLRKGVHTDDAEELCQDALLTLWHNQHRPRNARTFVMGIANRLAMAYHRKRARLQTVSIDDAPTEVHAIPEADAVSADDPRADAELRVAIAALLDRLTPRQREVVELVRLQGLPRRDAARQLGITEGALRFHEKQGLDRMRGNPDQPCPKGARRVKERHLVS
jgi:RNA polymerase sigma-70 factor (ECF subfamily)